MSRSPALVYDGFEFKEKETLARYVSLKRRFSISTFLSLATALPAVVLLLLYYLSPSTESPYLYLVFLAASLPFSALSFTSNSKITEIVNSNEVRHVVFA